jgi:hypothetical protein
MISQSFTVTSPTPQAINPDPVRIQQTLFKFAVPMAKRMSEAYQNNLKLSIAGVGAIATGSTIRSVQDQMVLESPSRGMIIRQVVSLRSIIFIQFGRKPGKAPIKYLGTKTSPSGRVSKWFEPVDGLVQWFLALGIRRALWMPIALAIGRRGIKPREVQIRAVKASETAWQSAIEVLGINFSKDIFK